MASLDDNKFDGMLMTVLQQRGNIDGFFDAIFGLLRRQTDFFSDQKKAEEIIVNTCKIHFEKFNKDQKQKLADEERKKAEAEKRKKEKEAKQATEKPQKVAEPVAMKPQTTVSTPETNGEKKEKEEDAGPAPLGNGGRTKDYIWTQTLENLEMFIFLENDVNKKNLKVNIAFEKLALIVKGETLIDGKWKGKINTEETYWTIEDGEIQDYKGKYLHINLQKWKNQTSWWSSPIEGHTQINTQKINPEPSKLSDLEGDTRSTVEKMMFDMRQKQQGLPSSDELEKQDKMKEFMKSHPEMDFSQCKFG